MGIQKSFVVVAGPTGSGKSKLAMELALAPGVKGEIVGCDSVQLYRGFDIGSAKPTAAERQRVPHHLIDVFRWDEECDAALYAKKARAALDDIRRRGGLPIVVGGTGLYLRALLGRTWHGDLPKDEALRRSLAEVPLAELYERLVKLDPERAKALHPNDRFRVARAIELVTLSGAPLSQRGFASPTESDPEAFIIKIEPDRAELHRRIEHRVDEMFAAGFLGEVSSLLESGVSPSAKVMGSIGYRECVAMLNGELEESELRAKIAASTRQYAKRQLTWNRKVNGDLLLLGPDLTTALPQVLAAVRR